MDTLWAPWRMQFIEDLRGKDKGCIFCSFLAPGNDKERLILKRGKSCLVVMNRYPYTSGHLMVIPHTHSGQLSEIPSAERTEMMDLVSLSVDILKKLFEAEGFNIGANIGKPAGAGIVDHVHMHVVPRWVGDTNFLPIIGETRSMPEYLHETYDKLVGEF